MTLEDNFLEEKCDMVKKPASAIVIALAEDTPAYKCLQSYGMLNTSFRKNHFEDIFEKKDLIPNSSQVDDLKKKFAWGVYWTPGCGFILYHVMNTELTVPAGYICRFVDNDNNYLFAKPGIHNISSPFIKQVGFPDTIKPNSAADGWSIIEHGNRTIVVVPQGKLGYATDMGQPVLLPPGLHSWTSETLRYEDTYVLDMHVIEVGPYTILTVDEGYAAITQNNGKQVILEGGETHLLTHQKWRFEKFITLKIQTDDLEKIRAASADNVIMSVNSTVVWRIKNVGVAAVMAAETMSTTTRGVATSADISKLRRDVLKQAIASLAGFIGSVNYSDSFHVAAAAQRNIDIAQAVSVGGEQGAPDHPPLRGSDNPMFDADGMSEAVLHANQITSKFGIEICSINIISANPVDAELTASLATGAVASAQALQAETQARGMAKAMKIQADAAAITRKIQATSEAEAIMIHAKATSDAEVLRAEGCKAAEILRAEGSKNAADLLEHSSVAVTLETIKTSAMAIKESDKFFFGKEPSYMSNILLNNLNNVAAAADI
eukprot:CAMPEP_0197828430 /NCGR_PEP_ID=MMETSP1437-20131217/4992_1 /TAXON_ID=49252 ORGANISM="Eucampia antarctica, Strain CCMP1452" /NCGR_SAMPLE_ID=MMETSP1437 /ASSEMBLY_ACC=CAM_ASM_001096 /LENGTH=547 /DNA_ID=CAMNT_0043429631 /DNA_START=273 /DNA_END=1916 /DNA_ORIENTATION=+